ncbi:hypothetical protein CHUAL_000746 [Chamberlinius hualienensis]
MTDTQAYRLLCCLEGARIIINAVGMAFAIMRDRSIILFGFYGYLFLLWRRRVFLYLGLEPNGRGIAIIQT